MYAINPNDSMIQNLQYNQSLVYINTYRSLINLKDREPVIFRGMAKRKVVDICKSQNRDFYYMDTGYLGNINSTKKDYHRIVKNNVQHTKVNYDMPSYRFENLLKYHPYIKFNGWKKGGKSILVVVPSDKPCKFYNIDKQTWIEQTVSLIKKYTDRQIIIREKQPRNKRATNNLYKQIVQDDVYAIVTYNSIAAIEAICFGIPAFTGQDTAANEMCSKDFSKIESPFYPNRQKVEKWQHWLAFCQYSIRELQTGKAMKTLKEYNLQ